METLCVGDRRCDICRRRTFVEALSVLFLQIERQMRLQLEIQIVLVHLAWFNVDELGTDNSSDLVGGRSAMAVDKSCFATWLYQSHAAGATKATFHLLLPSNSAAAITSSA